MRVGQLFIAGQPDADALEAAKAAGVTWVVDLRDPSETDFDEAGAAAALGLAYRNVVVAKSGPFQRAAFAEISALVEAHPGEPMLIHCASGNRAAGWLATHLVEARGASIADALAIARKAGITKSGIVDKTTAYLGAEVDAGDAPPD